MRVLVAAHAKINLCLFVGPPLPGGTVRNGRNVGGFHDIASWMAPIGLHDDVEVEKSADGASHMQVRWADDAPRPTPIDWPVEKDLAWRAHRALESAIGKAMPCRTLLSKRTPVGGGLGGGSADAAAMLRAVAALFDIDLSPDLLARIAPALGSDVAFFCDHAPPRPAVVSGLGESIERVARVQGEVALIIPPFSCPTGPVYKAYDAAPARQESPTALSAHRIAERGLPRDEDAPKLNDLEAAACVVAPALRGLLTMLRGAGLPAAVTGSGSCFFVLSPTGRGAATADAARRALSALPAAQQPVVVETALV